MTEDEPEGKKKVSEGRRAAEANGDLVDRGAMDCRGLRSGGWRGGLVVAVAMAGTMTAALGQSLRDGNLQVHGFATQSLVYGSGNNYLGMDTTSGSLGWTEAAVNVNDQLTDKLRVGVQLHLTRLGAFGGNVPTVDWALVDYSAKPWLGIRAGKVKIKWGLFNDTQDADPGYLWSLLPESVYGIDVRATNLSQYGAELYGKIRAGEHLGSLEYSAYYGYYYYASNDGYGASFAQQGITFTHPGFGKTPGFDLRWSTPVKGLTVGGSLMMYNASGTLTNGTYHQPLAFWPTYYAQYKRKKLYAAWQYVRLVQYQTVSIDGSAPATSGLDTRAWFAMGGYHVTDKLQLGTYYTRYTVPSAGDNSNSANFFKDAVISGRYDINAHLYTKVEGHLIHGNALGFYALDNSNALVPTTNLVVAKVGVTF